MIFSRYLDLIFIKFPILFVLTYLFFLFSFPEQEQKISLLVLLILAEPHFGATWTIFMDKEMRQIAKSREFDYIQFSIFLLILSILFFIISKNIFYILFFLYNAWHVTKQSIGICKLYSSNPLEVKFQNNILCISNILIVFFGAILYLMIGLISKETSFSIGRFFIFLTFLVFFYQLMKYKSFENSLTTFTGISIFLPSFFVSKPIHALLAGVTMHYSQYIALTLKLYLSKHKGIYSIKNVMGILFYVKGYLIWIISYGLLATSLTFIGAINKDFYSNLLILPILGQIIHFYLDGLVWQFRDPRIRETNLKHLIS